MRRGWRGPALVVSGVTLLALGGERTVFHLERHDTFCIACHLHERKYEEFMVPIPEQRSLAAKHHAPKGVRCIDCHGGEGLVGRAQVLALAAFDTAKYAAGLYREPETMRLPLSNRACTKCHESDLVPKGAYATAYHALTPHATLELRCVACHAVHPPGSPRHKFLDERRVLPICKECHRGMFD